MAVIWTFGSKLETLYGPVPIGSEVRLELRSTIGNVTRELSSELASGVGVVIFTDSGLGAVERVTLQRQCRVLCIGVLRVPGPLKHGHHRATN